MSTPSSEEGSSQDESCCPKKCAQLFDSSALENFKLNFVELPKAQKDALLVGCFVSFQKIGFC